MSTLWPSICTARLMNKEDRELVYAKMTAFIGHLETHRCECETKCNSKEIDEQIALLWKAKELIREWTDPCDIPF